MIPRRCLRSRPSSPPTMPGGPLSVAPALPGQARGNLARGAPRGRPRCEPRPAPPGRVARRPLPPPGAGSAARNVPALRGPLGPSGRPALGRCARASRAAGFIRCRAGGAARRLAGGRCLCPEVIPARPLCGWPSQRFTKPVDSGPHRARRIYQKMASPPPLAPARGPAAGQLQKDR